jgi:hypothetical protein
MFEVKEDCFAFREVEFPSGKTRRGCDALKLLYCASEECKFYKPIDTVCQDCCYDDCKGCAAEKKAK